MDEDTKRSGVNTHIRREGTEEVWDGGEEV
jgi:hypothetical protein